MVTTAMVVEALAPFGVSNIGFIAIEGTPITAIRITDQTYEGRQGHSTVEMIAHDIIAPLGLDLNGFASNALYAGDDGKGAAIMVRGLHA